MIPFYEENDVLLLLGDARRTGLPDGSIQSCVTSPPYWGLRDYGVNPLVWGGSCDCQHEWGDQIRVNATNHTGKARWNHTRNGRDEEQPIENRVAWLRTEVDQGAHCHICGAWRGSLGLEPTPESFVEHVVEVFREVRRVLADDGTVWLNLGDCYATGAGKVGECPGGGEQGEKWAGSGYRGTRDGSKKHAAGIGPMTQPNRMPIPGLKPKDLVGVPWMVAFALRADGWYLRQDIVWAKPNPMPESVTDRCTKSHEYLFLLSKSERYFYDDEAIQEPSVTDDIRRPYTSEGAWQLDGRPPEQRHGGKPRGKAGANALRGQGHFRESESGPANRNGRDMAEVGAGITRNKRSVWTVSTKPYPGAHFATFPPDLIEPCILAGSRPGDLVLDPFNGSGTTGAVCQKWGRRYVGVDLNRDYLELSKNRFRQGVLFPAGAAGGGK